MTTELEEEFFNVFGVEPKEYCKHFKYTRSLCDKINECGCQDCIGKYTDYPKITAEILLELICILSQKDNNYMVLEQQKSVEELKEYIIRTTIDNKCRVDTHKIKALFGSEVE